MKIFFPLIATLLLIPAGPMRVYTPTIFDVLDGGQIVFAPLASGKTYMINEEKQIVKTWSSNYLPGLSVYWNPDNSIYRAMLIPGGGDIGGQGGGVQKIASDGTILWEFTYTTGGKWAHHDIYPLPNGNILMLAREFKTFEETFEAGRDPNVLQIIQGDPQFEMIIEVQPTGPTSGDIVWEWHIWDHLIQDYDPLKDNYGVVSQHPELADINYGNELSADWLHANSLDYNAELDQILLSVRNFDEVWIIDHSTTTEQAAGHSGGMYGKGGDLLYRWGNPQSYDRGGSSDRVFFLQHDARWVPYGYPGGGNILVFNNGVGRGYSSVDEFTPPIDSQGNYNLTQDAYGPLNLYWSYVANPPESFRALHLSGEARLPNGNTLILQGESGVFIVVNPEKEILWSYTSPAFLIFKPFFVPNSNPTKPDLDTEGSLQWNSIKPGQTVTGSFIVGNIGTGRVNWSVDMSLLDWGTWTVNPVTGYNYPNNTTTVTVNVIVPSQENSEFEGYVKVINTNDPSDYELVPVILTISYSLSTKTDSILILKSFLNQMKKLSPLDFYNSI